MSNTLVLNDIVWRRLNTIAGKRSMHKHKNAILPLALAMLGNGSPAVDTCNSSPRIQSSPLQPQTPATCIVQRPAKDVHKAACAPSKTEELERVSEEDVGSKLYSSTWGSSTQLELFPTYHYPERTSRHQNLNMFSLRSLTP